MIRDMRGHIMFSPYEAIRLKYNRFLDNKWIVKLINLGTIAVVADYLIGLMRLTFINTITLQNLYNPLLWKVTRDSEHHFWDILIILLLYIVLCIRTYKIGYKMYGLISIFFFYFTVSMHEELWYLTYTLAHIFYNIPFQVSWLNWGSLWTPDLIIVVAFFYFYKRTHNLYKTRYSNKKSNIDSESESRIQIQNIDSKHRLQWNMPYLYFISLVSIYIIWFILKFPITVDYTGQTIYFFSNWINFLEIFSWVFPILIFLLTFTVVKPSGEEPLSKSQDKSTIKIAYIKNDSIYTSRETILLSSRPLGVDRR